MPPRYRFKQPWSEEEDSVERFLLDFFGSREVQASFRVAGTSGMTCLLGVAKSVKWRPLRVSVTNMGFFDRLEEEGIVGEGGAIQRCMEDIIDGVTTSNKLRDMLVNEARRAPCTRTLGRWF